MKKIVSLLLIVFMAAALLPACTGPAGNTGGGLKIVSTIFPGYDWVKNIIEGADGGTELILLADSGIDMHSFQPTVDDVITISTCDVFIYVGGESDEWADDALSNAKNKNMTVINMLDVLGDAAKTEEIVEGMEEEEHEHGHDHLGDGAGGEAEYDEHVWLSLRNAAVICSRISSELCRIDPGNSDRYKANTEKYLARLSELDGEYKKAVNGAAVRTLLFGDRFPFRYLTDDYGLDYYAAFAGCSAETEASFETVIFLTGKIDELGLRNIIVTESSDGKLAGTVRDSTSTRDQTVLAMDSMQSTTSADIEKGATYTGIMESNLRILKMALG